MTLEDRAREDRAGMEGRVYETGLVHGAAPDGVQRQPSPSPANWVCVILVTNSFFFFFNFEGEIFNFKMSAGNRDIGKRTLVLCVTCTSKRRRGGGSCLCRPLTRVASEPITETPGGPAERVWAPGAGISQLRVLAVPLLPGWSWRPCRWNRAHWGQRSRRNTDGTSGQAVSIWVPALSPGCWVPTTEGPRLPACLRSSFGSNLRPLSTPFSPPPHDVCRLLPQSCPGTLLRVLLTDCEGLTTPQPSEGPGGRCFSQLRKLWACPVSWRLTVHLQTELQNTKKRAGRLCRGF